MVVIYCPIDETLNKAVHIEETKTRKAIFTDNWGELAWLDPKDYFEGNWRYKGTLYNLYGDGSDYDVVMDNTGEFRYTRIWER